MTCKLDPKTEPICYRAKIFDPIIQGDRYCGECKGTGYYQRHINAFEIMPITDDLRLEIAKGTTPIQIRQMAIDAGMQTLLAYSHDLLKHGFTSLGDIARMVTDIALPEEKKFNLTQVNQLLLLVKILIPLVQLQILELGISILKKYF